MNEIVMLLGATWAEKMTSDISQATEYVGITALSINRPGKNEATPWNKLYSAICAAPKQCKEVHFWLPASNKAYPATLGNNRIAEDLARAGVFVHLIPGSHLLHAKTCTVDDQIAYVGSGNFTAAAAHYNHEAYVRCESGKMARKLRARWELLA